MLGRAVLAIFAQRCFVALVQTPHTLDIKLSFRIGGNAGVFAHRVRPRVVGGRGQTHIIAKLRQELGQVLHATANILGLKADSA